MVHWVKFASVKLVPTSDAPLRRALLRSTLLRSALLRSAPLRSILTPGCCVLHSFQTSFPCCRRFRCFWSAMMSFPPLGALYYTYSGMAQQGLSSILGDGGVNYARTTTGRIWCGYAYSQP